MMDKCRACDGRGCEHCDHGWVGTNAWMKKLLERDAQKTVGRMHRYRLTWGDGVVREVDASCEDEAIAICQKGAPLVTVEMGAEDRAKTKPPPERGWRIGVEFKKQDLWIGAYWDRAVRFPTGGYAFVSLDVWVCLIPCLPIHFQFWWVM
jgi:hypothetical protein